MDRSGEGTIWTGVGKGQYGQEWGRHNMDRSGEGTTWTGVGKAQHGQEWGRHNMDNNGGSCENTSGHIDCEVWVWYTQHKSCQVIRCTSTDETCLLSGTVSDCPQSIVHDSK